MGDFFDNHSFLGMGFDFDGNGKAGLDEVSAMVGFGGMLADEFSSDDDDEDEHGYEEREDDEDIWVYEEKRRHSRHRGSSSAYGVDCTSRVAVMAAVNDTSFTDSQLKSILRSAVANDVWFTHEDAEVVSAVLMDTEFKEWFSFEALVAN